MGDRPEEFFTVAELRNFISLKLDRYDVKAALDKHAASLAPMTSQIVVETRRIADGSGLGFFEHPNINNNISSKSAFSLVIYFTPNKHLVI